MHTARRMGHFLSDIVKGCQSAIRPHMGRELYAYLRALITKPVDYGYLRAQQEKKEAEQGQKASEIAHREAFIREGMEKVRGRTFATEDGTRSFFEERNFVYTKTFRNDRWYTGSLPAHQAYSLIEKIWSGKLREISVEEVQKAQTNALTNDLRTRRAPDARFLNHLDQLRAILQAKAPQPACS